MRKSQAIKKPIQPDVLYNSKLVSKLINNIMLDGKKAVASKILYDAFDIIKKETGNNPVETLEAALENVMPVIEVRSRRIGGSNYQVPMEVKPERRQTLALRWIVHYARLRNEKTAVEKIAKELLDASNNSGQSVKKREELHKTAEANRAFAHYRW